MSRSSRTSKHQYIRCTVVVIKGLLDRKHGRNIAVASAFPRASAHTPSTTYRSSRYHRQKTTGWVTMSPCGRRGILGCVAPSPQVKQTVVIASNFICPLSTHVQAKKAASPFKLSASNSTLLVPRYRDSAPAPHARPPPLCTCIAACRAGKPA